MTPGSRAIRNAARIAAVVAAIVAAGCHVTVINPPHELTDRGRQVSVAERRIDVLPCTKLGTVQGRASSIFRQDVLKDIQIDARNKAAFQGANRIIQKPTYELIRNQDMGTTVFDMYLCRDTVPPVQDTTPEPHQSAALDRHNNWRQ